MTNPTKKLEFLQSTNPRTQKTIAEKFSITSETEMDHLVKEAYHAWKIYKNIPGSKKATFLRTIADEIEALGDTLVHRAMEESGLPEARIKGERGRTCNQLRLFASYIEEGSWVDAIIDEALPDRKPMPRVDIRKMSISIGPVAIFTASNFPLAFSTAGGDTTSALAAGCPVIVKAHPSHLGTNSLVSKAISISVDKCNLPSGVFTTIVGGIETGQQLVQHPLVKAVGFTGSYSGGKAIYDIANNRPEPIPVYAEMGSNNPVFILQEKLKSEYSTLATNIAHSVNMGAGQFCTNPGILVLQKGDITNLFLEKLKIAFSELKSFTMLNEGIHQSYNIGKNNCINSNGVSVIFENKEDENSWTGKPAVAYISATNFIENKKLQTEIFGPFTLAVICENESELTAVAHCFHGQLTATVMATNEEVEKYSNLIELLSQKAGRIIFNGLPTGVEVCHAMHHGGPFPSSSNALFTSVGTGAIHRFVRPVAFQNMPDTLLPDALKQSNPLQIWRTINGQKSKA